jgi:uncharacterized membrane protein
MKLAMRRAPLDLLAVVLAGVLALLASLATPHLVALRAIFGLPFLILGPGYALTSALYRREPPEPAMRLLLSLALSIAAIILVGLALNVVGIALGQQALITALLVVSASACGIAATRRQVERGPESFAPARALRSPWLWSTTILLTIFAGLLAALARPLPDSDYAGYTELSGLRSGANVRVAVKSVEHRRTTYRLQARAASGRVISRTFSLMPDQQWSQIVHIGTPLRQTVQIRLYLTAAPSTVYREVILRA